MTTVPDLRARIWGRIAFVTFMTPNTFVWNCFRAAAALQTRMSASRRYARSLAARRTLPPQAAS